MNEQKAQCFKKKKYIIQAFKVGTSMAVCLLKSNSYLVRFQLQRLKSQSDYKNIKKFQLRKSAQLVLKNPEIELKIKKEMLSIDYVPSD